MGAYAHPRDGVSTRPLAHGLARLTRAAHPPLPVLKGGISAAMVTGKGNFLLPVRFFSNQCLLRYTSHVLGWSPEKKLNRIHSSFFSIIQACKISACVLQRWGLAAMPWGEEDYHLFWKDLLQFKCQVGGCCGRNLPISSLSLYDKNLRLT